MTRFPWLSVPLAGILSIPLAAHAEVGDRSPEQLHEAASSVLVGTVQPAAPYNRAVVSFLLAQARGAG